MYILNLWFRYAARSVALATVLTVLTHRTDLTLNFSPPILLFGGLALLTRNPADKVRGRLTPDLSAGYGKAAAKLHALFLLAGGSTICVLNNVFGVLPEEQAHEMLLYGFVPSAVLLGTLVLQSVIDDARLEALNPMPAPAAVGDRVHASQAQRSL